MENDVRQQTETPKIERLIEENLHLLSAFNESNAKLNETSSKLNETSSKLNETSSKLSKTEFKLTNAEQRIQLLEDMLRLERHNKFGKKSESAKANQFELGFEAGEIDLTPDEIEEDVVTTTVNGYERKKQKPGRKIDTSKLERERILHDLTEEEKQCECCGEQRTCIGEDISEKIEVIPSQFKVIEHVRPKYACKRCETIKSAPKPDCLLPKSMAGTSLLTETILAKYQYHLPLYRQSQIYKNNGVDIPDNTLGNWILAVGEALDVLNIAFQKQFSKTYYIQADETPVKILSENKKGYMWAFHGLDPGNRFVLYHYSTSRSSSVANTMLEKFKGLLQTDGYAGYNALRARKTITGIACMAHVRRKFVDVIKVAGNPKKPGKAHQAVAFIEKLYCIEKRMRKDGSTPEQRLAIRQREAKPILDKFKAWLDKSIHHVPGGLPITKAIAYALRQWPYLYAYCEHGEVEIDNNLVENLIRPLAIGRKNWMFVGNQRGADAAAILYSLIQTCIINNIRTRDYFNAILPLIPKVRRGELEAESLLPQFYNQSN